MFMKLEMLFTSICVILTYKQATDKFETIVEFIKLSIYEGIECMKDMREKFNTQERKIL